MKATALPALLKKELSQRSRRNPRYSLRSFSKSLKMDPSTLSKIMSGKRSLSTKSTAALMRKLGLDASGSADAYDLLKADESEQMSNWQDFAILEQLSVTGFKANKESLSKALGLSAHDIGSSVNKLKHLGFIDIKPSGRIKERTSGQSTNITPGTSTVKKNLQRQFLEKAIASIDFDPISERDMTTITVAVDSSKFAEAQERIKQFRREMSEFLGSGNKKDRVYNMSIAFYPTTKTHKERE